MPPQLPRTKTRDDDVIVISRKMIIIFVAFCIISSATTHSSATPTGEEAALLAFAAGVKQKSSPQNDGDSGVCRISESWRSGGSGACSFCGITCSTDGSVVAVTLRGLGLDAGELKPNTLTSRLHRLQTLDLSDNGLTGQLPDDFNASAILFVDLSGNSFTGTIPPSLASLRSLQTLNLSSNFLHGTIPLELTQLHSLQNLDLHGNSLSGGIHPAFLSLPSLVSVDLSDNSLGGFLPWQPNDTLPLLRTLQYVNLSRNLLAGPLAPPKFVSVFAERLRVLDMSHNLLSGDLPDFEFAVDLAVLRLHHNLFTGSVPETLLSANLEELDLSANNLTGSIGRVLSTSLSLLNLSSNSLYGTIPPTAGPCTVVDLSRNRFYGDLSSMQYWSDMVEVLDLGFNNLAGTLPPVDRFIRLAYLDISHNAISGALPELPPKLASLDLSFNRLTGRLPPSFIRSPTLRRLSLSDNGLVGHLELASLPLLRSPLVFLDLSRNQLYGNIDISPAIASGHLPNLQVLSLSGNRLSGTLPSGLCNFTSLRQLDLSANLLMGAIPDSLPDSLMYLNLSQNRLTGLIPPNLHRFAASSFFPGNDGLTYATDGSPESRLLSTDGGQSRIPGAVKVGIIAGTAGGFALILAVWLLLLYTRLPNTVAKYSSNKKSIAIGSTGSGSTKSSSIWSACTSCNGTSTERVLGSSSSLILMQEASSARRYKGWSSASAVSEGVTSSSLVRHNHHMHHYHHDMVGTADVMMQEYIGGGETVSAAYASPDRLAGDLYFLDTTLRFTAEELSRAPAEILGRSSHGTTYKATLGGGGGTQLAVKWLREGLAKNKREFGREAQRFSKFRHPNLNPLRGYYWGPHHHEKLILSDYVPTGSLAAYFVPRLPSSDDHRIPTDLVAAAGATRAAVVALTLSWEQRLAITVDVVRGLLYLHEEKRQPHGNLKASNVLVDMADEGKSSSKVRARLCDYGLYQLMRAEGMERQMMNAGALGYRAPEMGNGSDKPTAAADVYAVGVMMLEMVTGRQAGDIMLCGQWAAVDVSDWVRMLASRGTPQQCFDPQLLAAVQNENNQMYGGGGEESTSDGVGALPTGIQDLLELGLLCISPNPSSRPSIARIWHNISSIASRPTTKLIT